MTIAITDGLLLVFAVLCLALSWQVKWAVKRVVRLEARIREIETQFAIFRQPQISLNQARKAVNEII